MSEIRAETPVSSIVWGERRTLFGVLGFALAAGLVYTLFAPPIWEASATLVFPVKSPSILGASGIGDAASGIAALAGGPTPLKVYGGFLESQRTREYVGSRVGKKPRDVKDMTLIVDQTSESSLTVSARDRDAALAKRVVTLHLEALERINRDLSGPLEGDDTKAIGEQLAKEKAKLREAEARLLAFQQGAKTAPSVATSGAGKDASIMPVTSRWADMQKGLEIEKGRVDAALASAHARLATVSKSAGDLPVESATVSEWRNRLTQAEYNLQVALLTLAPQSPEVEKLNEGIAIAKAHLATEVKNYVQAVGLGVMGSSDKGTGGLPELMLQQAGLDAQLGAVRRLAAEAPAETIELSRLTREVATEGAVVSQLQGQHSLAALQGERDPQHWQVLDAPEVDDKAVNKSFSKNLAMATIAGLALGFLASLVQAKRRKPPVVALTTVEGDLREAA